MNKSLENIKAKMSRSLSLNISISENQTRSVRKPLVTAYILFMNSNIIIATGFSPWLKRNQNVGLQPTCGRQAQKLIYKMWLKPLFGTHFFHGLKPVAIENQIVNSNLYSFLLCSEIINNQIKTKINDCKLQ
jgi:hypothetical protein